jgi:hypothetical protein
MEQADELRFGSKMKAFKMKEEKSTIPGFNRISYGNPAI